MSIYKDCDIRGIYKEEFDEKEAYLIGKAIGTLYSGLNLVVGGDVRLSTPVLKESMIKGMLETGIHVVDLGVVSTPLFYFSIKELKLQGGVMVTASHNPAKYNGFKLMFGDKPISKESICKIKETVDSGNFTEVIGTYKKVDMFPAYKKFIMKSFTASKIKIVVDCCDGATSKIVPDIMESMGYDVVRLYCGSDGNFPNRDPNPANYDHLTDVCKKVVETHADMGAAYDGDGDRIVFIDNKGRVVISEKSLAIFIADYLKVRTGSVVYDQKSASVVKDTILKYGGIPLMERSGYGFIKQRFLDNRSLMAGEISGHFFFSEIGNDDGLYATLKMAKILAGSDKTLAEMADELPTSIITPDLRMFCRYDRQDEWLEKVRNLKDRFEINEMDGVRVTFDCGWFLIRKSVTEQAVTFRIEAKDEAGMQSIKKAVLEVLPELGGHKFFQN